MITSKAKNNVFRTFFFTPQSSCTFGAASLEFFLNYDFNPALEFEASSVASPNCTFLRLLEYSIPRTALSAQTDTSQT